MEAAMSDWMIGRCIRGLSVDPETHPGWVEEPMLHSILNLSAASFNCFDKTESSDSKTGWTLDLKAEVERPANGGTYNRHKDGL